MRRTFKTDHMILLTVFFRGRLLFPDVDRGHGIPVPARVGDWINEVLLVRKSQGLVA